MEEKPKVPPMGREELSEPGRKFTKNTIKPKRKRKWGDSEVDFALRNNEPPEGKNQKLVSPMGR
jgi:hypothetical protein